MFHGVPRCVGLDQKEMYGYVEIDLKLPTAEVWQMSSTQ